MEDVMPLAGAWEPMMLYGDKCGHVEMRDTKRSGCANALEVCSRWLWAGPWRPQSLFLVYASSDIVVAAASDTAQSKNMLSLTACPPLGTVKGI
jgi:hypothetical protein